MFVAHAVAIDQIAAITATEGVLSNGSWSVAPSGYARDVATRLDELDAVLHDGMCRSGQTSFGRRVPAAAAIPLLVEAQTGLRELVRECPDEPRGWRLLSLAEETMLAYPRALAALERALQLEGGHADKRDLKRLAALRAAAGEWEDLRLTPAQLAELGEFLAINQARDSTEDFALTRAWLEHHGFSEADARDVVEALRARGAWSDEQVLDLARGTTA